MAIEKFVAYCCVCLRRELATKHDTCRGTNEKRISHSPYELVSLDSICFTTECDVKRQFAKWPKHLQLWPVFISNARLFCLPPSSLCLWITHIHWATARLGRRSRLRSGGRGGRFTTCKRLVIVDLGFLTRSLLISC